MIDIPMNFWELDELLSEDNITKALKPYMKIIVRSLAIMEADAKTSNTFANRKREYIRILLEDIIIHDCVPKEHRKIARRKLDDEFFRHFYARTHYIIYTPYKIYTKKRGYRLI